MDSLNFEINYSNGEYGVEPINQVQPSSETQTFQPEKPAVVQEADFSDPLFAFTLTMVAAAAIGPSVWRKVRNLL